MARILLLVVASVGTLLSQEGWYWQNPVPQGNDLHAVFPLDRSTVYAVGGRATIIRSTNGGWAWESLRPGDRLSATLRHLVFINASTGFVVGDSGLILTTRDAGKSWSRSHVPSDGRALNRVVAATSQVIVAVGDGGTIVRSSNSGLSWNRVESGTLWDLNAVTFLPGQPGLGFAVGENNTMLRTIDGGVFWVPTDTPSARTLTDIVFTDQNNGWIVSSSGMALQTTNRGENWTRTRLPSAFPLYAISFPRPDRGLAVGEIRLVQTTNNGAQWQSSVFDTISILRDISFADSSVGWIVGSYGEIKNTVDGGFTWARQSSGFRVDFMDIECFDSLRCRGVGMEGRIISTDNGGQTWVVAPRITSSTLNSIALLGATAAVAVGTEGTIVRSLDGGSSWTQIPSGTSSILTSVAFRDGGTGFAVGFEGAILRTTNAGSSWASVQIPGVDSTRVFTRVTFVDQDVGWLVSLHGANRGLTEVRRTTDGGATWELVREDAFVSVLSLHFVDHDRGWAVGRNRTILRTTDGGTTWSVQYPKPPVSTFFFDVQFINHDVGWIVGTRGSIYKTVDGGSTWHAQKMPSGSSLNALFAIDTDRAWVVGSGGAILKTTDGGGTGPAPPPPPSRGPGEGIFAGIPNPFRPEHVGVVSLPFRISAPGSVTLRIYDLLGRTFHEQTFSDLPAGNYDRENALTPTWDGKDDHGNPMPSGIYFFRYTTRGFDQVGKVILVR